MKTATLELGDVVWTLGTPQTEACSDLPAARTLSTGEWWTNVTDYPSNDGPAGMDFTYGSSACGSINGGFKVVSATYDSNGQMTSIDVTFEQQCNGSTGALRGEFQWRAGDDVAPAPWMEPDATGFSDSSTPGGTTSGGSPGDTGIPTPQPGPSTGEAPNTGSADTAPITSATTSTTAGAVETPQTPTRTTSTQQLKRLTVTLSRDSRQAKQATRQPHGTVTLSWLRRARRSIAALQTAVTITERRLHTLALAPPAATRRALQRLSAWQTTLRAEQHILPLPTGRNVARLPALKLQANRQATAAIRALTSLGRPAKP